MERLRDLISRLNTGGNEQYRRQKKKWEDKGYNCHDPPHSVGSGVSLAPLTG
jgi:hypothetical protein